MSQRPELLELIGLSRKSVCARVENDVRVRGLGVVAVGSAH